MKKFRISLVIFVFILSLFVIWKTNIYNYYLKTTTNNDSNVKLEEKEKTTDTKTKETTTNNSISKENEQKENTSTNENVKSETNEKKSNNIEQKNYTTNSTEKNILDVQYQTQKVWNYCAPTAVSMMLSTKGKLVDQYTLAKEMGTYEPFGTHNKDAVRILNKHMFGYEYPQENQAGYRMEFVTNVSKETINTFKERVIKNIKDGYPLYLTFDAAKIYPGKKGEHNVILTGYKIENSNFYIYYLDPSPNVKDPVYGGLKILSAEELLTAMLTCEEPNYAW